LDADVGTDLVVRRCQTVGFTDWIVIEYQNYISGTTNWASADSGVVKSCFTEDYYYWACPAKKVSVRMGKDNDDLTVNADVNVPTVLQGGPGIDWIQGGGGPDEIWGGCSNGDEGCNGFKDTLHGGDGDDSLHGGASFDYLAGDGGDDRLDGGLGGDNLYGGDGRDLADSARKDGITASLDGVANDGAPGENDFIASDVEGIQGGKGKDTLYGGFLTSSILKGGPGDDTLVGFAGADLLMGEAGSDLLGLGSPWTTSTAAATGIRSPTPSA
jgi:Ca2+-binding RTX toxin-like protein